MPRRGHDTHATNQTVYDIDQDEFILIKGVDFGKGAKAFKASASVHLMGGSIELHLDSKSGPMIGKLKVGNTKGEYKELSTSVKNAKGVHDLYLVFKGGDFQQRNLFYLDWWEFSK